jgi:preprotein translocase subunit SecB
MTETAQPHFSLRTQYIKDFSFENPNSPASLIPKNTPPKLSVNVDIKATQLSEDAFEVVLHLTADAAHEDQTMFIVDLAYGGLFSIQNLSREQIEPLLFVDCPFLLFPFARRVIADATRDGGFPPLMLEPMDFHRMYVQQREQKAQHEMAAS